MSVHLSSWYGGMKMTRRCKNAKLEFLLVAVGKIAHLSKKVLKN